MRKTVLAVVAAVAVIAIAVGLWAFQPWKLLTSSRVDEASPLTPEAPSETTAAAKKPKVLSTSSFQTQEHATSGKALLIEKADGSRVLRFEDLSGSDGPDLHVWLTDQPAGSDDWGRYDDGRYVKLGKLKATHGAQNYAVPAGTDLDDLRSVVIWCDRFNVAFGSAKI